MGGGDGDDAVAAGGEGQGLEGGVSGGCDDVDIGVEGSVDRVLDVGGTRDAGFAGDGEVDDASLVGYSPVDAADEGVGGASVAADDATVEDGGVLGLGGDEADVGAVVGIEVGAGAVDVDAVGEAGVEAIGGNGGGKGGDVPCVEDGDPRGAGGGVGPVDGEACAGGVGGGCEVEVRGGRDMVDGDDGGDGAVGEYVGDIGGYGGWGFGEVEC